MTPASLLILVSIIAMAVFGLIILVLALRRAVRRRRRLFLVSCILIAVAALLFWQGYSNLWHTFAGSNTSGVGPAVFLTARTSDAGYDIAVDGDDGSPRPYSEFKCAVYSLEAGRPEVYDYMNQLTTGFCFFSMHIKYFDLSGDGHLDAGDAFKLYNIPAGMGLSFVIYHVPGQCSAGHVLV